MQVTDHRVEFDLRVFQRLLQAQLLPVCSRTRLRRYRVTSRSRRIGLGCTRPGRRAVGSGEPHVQRCGYRIEADWTVRRSLSARPVIHSAPDGVAGHRREQKFGWMECTDCPGQYAAHSGDVPDLLGEERCWWGSIAADPPRSEPDMVVVDQVSPLQAPAGYPRGGVARSRPGPAVLTSHTFPLS
jgi:hypothetical protein